VVVLIQLSPAYPFLIYQEENYEIWSTFAEVIVKIKMATFFRHGVVVTAAKNEQRKTALIRAHRCRVRKLVSF